MDAINLAIYEAWAWLIAQGKDVYEKALANPDWLAEYAPVVDKGGGLSSDPAMLEIMNYVASYAWREKHDGADMPHYNWIKHPVEPAGEAWEEADLPQRFPVLWAKFGWHDDDSNES